MDAFLSLFLHLDTTLGNVISSYGTLTYAVLFATIFIETGVVIMPFLPGDSLLFAAGTFAGIGLLNPWICFFLLAGAAILGDTVNYAIGRKLGLATKQRGNIFGIKIRPEYFEKAEHFYEKYGARAIIVARFMPIVRTFVPFIAGVGRMHYRNFFLYNVIGAITWVGLFITAGYFFGNIPVVKDNFSLVIIGIIVVSLIPTAIEIIRSQFGKQASSR